MAWHKNKQPWPKLETNLLQQKKRNFSAFPQCGFWQEPNTHFSKKYFSKDSNTACCFD